MINYLSKFKFNLTLSILTVIFVSSLLPQVSYCQESKIQISEIFVKRHSGKDFDPNLTLTPVQYESLIEAARWTPSSYNDQPWNFIFCDKNLNPEAYMTVLDSLYGTQKEWVENAPSLVVAVARTKDLYKGNFNEWAEYDTGAAVLAMSLQATDLGMMAHQIGGFDKTKIIEDFNLPQEFKPLTVIAVGYEILESEVEKPRTRRPSEENFFFGGWSQAMELESTSP